MAVSVVRVIGMVGVLNQGVMRLLNSAGGQDSPVSVQSTPPREALGLTWNEDLFNTPTYGNSGPPQAELTEMCIGLLEFFGRNHPDIASKLSFGLIIFGSFPCL